MCSLSAQLRLFSFHGSSCEDGRLTCEEDQCLVDEELIRRMHQHPLRHGWIAANHSIFWGRKLKEGLALRTGTFLPEEKASIITPLKLI
ncbi:putative peptidase C1-like protein F26E4.3 [Portunus trituberculatus]|uniref:Putative peptidase C1-like protein F26E4.3 n=1 Tax=Portunus trituberculatus TaxID=210409 RepID=A0A5B7JBZ7_PORTR|nr:putative peptidase C1-like protein F26E4.3 [Portunus trituberculatus]